MSEFAKLFDTPRGQVLVKVDADQEGAPEIRFYVKPEGFGVNSVAFGYEDSDQGWIDAEEGFEKVSYEMAEAAAKQVYDFTDNL